MPTFFQTLQAFIQQIRALVSTQETSYITQQRPESHTATLTWDVSKYKVYKLHQRYILKKDVIVIMVLYVHVNYMAY